MDPLTEGTATHEDQVVAGASLEHPAAAPHGKPDTDVAIRQSSGPVRIKLDGVVKTISGPVTGAALHRLAGEIDGYPVTLKSGGSTIPNDDKPVEVKLDQEFTTK